VRLPFAGTLTLVLIVATHARAAPPSSVHTDANRADEDVRALRQELNGFCERPKPLPSGDAIRMCGLAGEVPNCAGFKKQCDNLLKPRDAPSPFWEALARFLGSIAPALGWTVLALGLGSLLYVLVRSLLSRLRAPREEELPEQAPDAATVVTREAVPLPPGAPESLLERAEAALGRGDLREALHGFLHAALRALDVRGAIRITRDRTNGEYVRTCAEETARPELRAIVREVDVVHFGGRDPDPAQVAEVGRRATLLVRGAVMTLALLLVGGCQNSVVPKAPDPAGFDIAKALLERQGFKLARPKQPLARLEAPKPGAPAPAILIHGSKAHLDDEATAGLDRFVRGGGKVALFGPQWGWPKVWSARDVPTRSRDVVVGAPVEFDCNGIDEDACEEKAASALEVAQATSPRKARLAHGSAFRWDGQEGRAVASHEDGSGAYASVGEFGSGSVLGVAGADLMTNVGLSREGNASAFIVLVSHLGTKDLVVIDELGGITPSSDPLSSLIRAGLGLPLGHALFFALVLAVAVGARSRAPRKAPPEARRAFAEHVHATASLYAHAQATPHALACYGRFVVGRLRMRGGRGADAATVLSQRSLAPKDECQRLLDRVVHVKAGDGKRGDELATLRELCDLFAKAEAPAREPHTSKRRT